MKDDTAAENQAFLKQAGFSCGTTKQNTIHTKGDYGFPCINAMFHIQNMSINSKA